MNDAILDELAGTWEVMAEMEPDSKPGRRETLRECADALRMVASISRAAVRLGVSQTTTERETELESLLRSACAIAERRGIGTAWARFVANVHAIGLNGVTARTYRVLPSDGAAGEPTFDRTTALVLLSAAAKSGDPGAISLAAQLAGAAPCGICGFVNYKCRCKTAQAAGKPRKEFLALAESCGAQITGKPDGSESVTVVFTIDAWRKFDIATAEGGADMRESGADGL